MELNKLKLESLLPNNRDLSSINEVNTPVLGKLTGVYAKLNSMSVNGRFYSADFWNKVLSSKAVLDSLNSGSMIGIFEHPSVLVNYDKEGRMTARHPANGAFVTKSLQVVGEDIVGTSYIINSHLGRLLATYLLATDDNNDPLVHIHMSARGYTKKDYIDDQGIDQMNPNDYILQAFDAVLNPGIKGTRVKMESDDNSSALYNRLLSRSVQVDKGLMKQSLIHELGLTSNHIKKES